MNPHHDFMIEETMALLIGSEEEMELFQTKLPVD